ncbi:MAG: ExbD/TolR family protein, partial [Gemmatimonadaceae bacterium]
VLNLLLAVRVDNSGLLVEHSEEGGFRRQLQGMDDATLDQLQALMTDIRQRYPQNSDVLVIPSDDVNYDNVIRVLERLKLARYTGISLGTRARATEVAATGAAGGSP